MSTRSPSNSDHLPLVEDCAETPQQLCRIVDAACGPVERLVPSGTGWDGRPRRVIVGGRAITIDHLGNQSATLLTVVCGQSRVGLRIVSPTAGPLEAALVLNRFDVAVIQHEHGVHREADAEELLDLSDRLLVAMVLVVRTVLSQPTAHQRYVLEMLTQSADAVVTMLQSGQRRPLDGLSRRAAAAHADPARRGGPCHGCTGGESGTQTDDTHLGSTRAGQSKVDVVLLCYDSDEQVTSGVLTEALAAGIPVVATGFPHAVDLLGGERGGIIVPQKDPTAIATAMMKIIHEPSVGAAMSAHNAALATLMSWPTVAGKYRLVFDAVTRRPPTPS